MRNVLIALAALGTVAAAGPASAADRVAAGTLRCNVAGGVGLIVGSSKEVQCRYRSADGRVNETYTGNVSKIGVDIGVTGKSTIAWQVLAPTSKLGLGALAGTYSGVTGQATVGVGAGANVLVGGSNRTVSLQPLSVSAQTGLNVAAGIGSLTLEPANGRASYTEPSRRSHADDEDD
jgi:hypothetical protein